VERETGDPLLAKDAGVVDFYEHLYRLAKIRGSRAARDEIPGFLKIREKEGAIPPEQVKLLTSYLESAVALATHDRAAFLAAAARVNEPGWRLQKAILEGNLDEARRMAGDLPGGTAVLEHLALYVLFQRANRSAEAAAELTEATTGLASGGAERVQWAEWLRGDVAPDARLAAHTCDDPDNHGVLLTALAEKFPARGSEYLARAAKMKFVDTYYTLALERTEKK
jgi:hypothetical protein